jgi:hypothetical protein
MLETWLTGRRTSSDTRATMIGVAAALNSVPGPQIFETVNELTADATLATISVWSEIDPPVRPPTGPAGAVDEAPTGLAGPGVTNT